MSDKEKNKDPRRQNSQANRKPYDWSPCEGCYCKNLTVWNTKTGNGFTPVCKSYKCEKHGWLHAKRLEKALTKHFSSFKYIRLWTFTLSSRVATSTDNHYKLLSKIWKVFITEIRRSKTLPASYKDLQYVRVAEPHKSGFWHFHVLVDRYMNWWYIFPMWLRACEVVLKQSGKWGHCDVRGRKTPESGAKYVVKYVLKSSKVANKFQKVWTKSSKVSIFPYKTPVGLYVVFDKCRKIWIGTGDETTLTCHYIKSSSQDKSKNSIFELDLVDD